MPSEGIDKPGTDKKKTSTGYEDSTVTKGRVGGAVPKIEGPVKHTTGYGGSEVSGPSASPGEVPPPVTDRTYSDQPRRVPKARRTRSGVNQNLRKDS